MAAISPVSSARGVSKATPSPRAFTWPPGAAIAEGATGSEPSGRIEEWEMRPQCQIWLTMRPPFACTAAVTWRQPSIWAGECTPGAPG